MTVVWCDGSIRRDEATWTPPGASYGVFTTIGCDDGRPLLWERHQLRLLSSLAAMGAGQVVLPERDEICEVLQVSNLMGPARLRIVVRRVDGPAWTVIASVETCRALGPAAPPARLRQHRWLSAPPLAGHKSLARLPWDLAGEHARRAGYDDALLLDAAGNVLETSVANVFVLRQGVARTPHAPTHCLPGVMRAWLLDNLERIGVSTEVGDVAAEDLRSADEVWITNAVVGVRRVEGVDRVEWCEWPRFSLLSGFGVPAPGWPKGP